MAHLYFRKKEEEFNDQKLNVYGPTSKGLVTNAMIYMMLTEPKTSPDGKLENAVLLSY